MNNTDNISTADVLSQNMDVQLSNSRDLKSIMDAWKQLIQEKSPGDSEFSNVLANLSQACWDYYNRDQKVADLEDTIRYSQAAISTLPSGVYLCGVQHTLSLACKIKYDTFGEFGDLQIALQHAQEAVRNTPLGHNDLSGFQQNLGYLYLLRSQRLETFLDIEAGIRCGQAALDNIPPGDSDKLANCQQIMAIIYTERYQQLSDVVDLEIALSYDRAALENTLPGDSSISMRQHNLAISYTTRYQALRNREDLELSLFYGHAAIDNTPSEHPNLRRCYQSLASSYLLNYYESNDIADCDAALSYDFTALENTPNWHNDYLENLKRLSRMCGEKYKDSKNIEYLEAAQVFGQAVVDRLPQGHPEISGYQQRLAMHYDEKYERLDQIQDLDAALSYNKIVVEDASPDHPDLALYQHRLALSYRKKYLELGNMVDLEEALKYNKAAVINTPLGHPDLPGHQQNLAASYSDRFQKIRDIQDFHAALRHDIAALDGNPPDHENFLSNNHGLAVLHVEKYRRLGDVDALELALKYGHIAVDRSLKGDPALAIRQRTLASAYRHRYLRLGLIKDLEAALHYNLSALDCNPAENFDVWDCYQAIGLIYTDRYQRLGNAQDIEAALEYSHKAVDSIPPEHPELASQHHSLAISYSHKFKMEGNFNDLETALGYERMAVTNTPLGSSDLPYYLQSLAMSYTAMGNISNKIQDFEASLRCNQAAAECVPHDDPDFPDCQTNLAVSYTNRFYVSKNIEDLETALKHNKIAVENTPLDHPSLPGFQQNLAGSYINLYQTLWNTEDLHMASKVYQQASKSQTALPHHLWDVTIQWANLTSAYDLPETLLAYTSSISVLPSLLWMGSSVDVRHNALVRHNIADIVSAATAAALKFHELEKAVEFLEQGLSTTHKKTLQLKSDLPEELKLQLPEQAQELQKLSVQLRAASINNSQVYEQPPSKNVLQVQPSVNYNLLAQKREDLISEIQGHIGFEDFLLPSPFYKLAHAAQDGPVIMINSTSKSTDAIIIISPHLPPKHISLPEASTPVANKHLKALQEALNVFSIRSRESRMGRLYKKDKSTSDQVLGTVIFWLWNSVVKPVFSSLLEIGISKGRLWWCPSGPFTYLPLHAAAPLGDEFVQSYTPTLGALIIANKKYKEHPVDASDVMMAVGVTEVPGVHGSYSSLPSVAQELELVTTIFGANTKLLDEKATAENITKGMASSGWIHLACHGQQDRSNPLDSGLILYNGRLRLGQILDLDLPLSKFVYLSACETAMGDAKLVNEAMHLTGGFIAAGFQGAIGTLWSMSDVDGPKVAEIVYRTIIGNNSIPDVKLAAKGLHLAIQKLRRDGVPLHQWMPFIHMGI
ncbi:CHAT domain-containing protein [Collybia nuda]|uniref:CHAT domain-containing protein n=1 Tax=Collybia nuda TaxID=64659 RepID=A0A9P5YAN2_9AGAR|nr:CHAT domain-containing protein [Collybia nuda]